MSIIQQLGNSNPSELEGLVTKMSVTNVDTESPEFIDGDLFFKCCDTTMVLASLTSDLSYQNDYTSIFHTGRVPFNNAEFFLYKGCEEIASLNDNTYGVFYAQGTWSDDPNASGYYLQWQKVLQLHGGGTYKIKKVVQTYLIGGDDIESFSCDFELCHYSNELAHNTVRIETIQNSYYYNSRQDFRDKDWKNMLRLKGSIQIKDPKVETKNYLNSSRQIRDIQTTMYNTYELETEFSPYCVNSYLVPTQENKSLMSQADDIFITSYNQLDHFPINQVPVIIEKIKINSPINSGKASLSISFEDRKRNHLKRPVR